MEKREKEEEEGRERWGKIRESRYNRWYRMVKGKRIPPGNVGMDTREGETKGVVDEGGGKGEENEKRRERKRGREREKIVKRSRNIIYSSIISK